MKRSTKSKAETILYEPNKVIFMTVVVAVLTLIVLASISLVATA